MPERTGSAARRYAEAVFELAKEENRRDAWEHDLSLLAQTFSQGDEATWLANPTIPLPDKEALLDGLLASAGQEARNLAKLLASHGRGHLASQILDAYRSSVEKERGIVRAQGTTAVSLTPDEQEAVHHRLTELTGQEVTIELDVDPSIMGGIIVRIEDKLIDGSARARLLEMRRRLAGTTR